MKYLNTLEMIGNTPLLKLTGFEYNNDSEIWLKIEGLNPSGSIKDRVVLNMVKYAELAGELTKEKEILEVTSGNTGVSLSMIGSMLGYTVTVVMSEDATDERKKLIKLMGARLILTDKSKGEMGAKAYAEKLHQTNEGRYWFMDQFSNPNNPEAHTGGVLEEILSDLPEVTHIIAGMGTGGTVLGIEDGIRQKGRDIKVIGVQPVEMGAIDGLVNFSEEGVPSIWEGKVIENLVYVERFDAIKTLRQLVKSYGVLSGISTGANLWHAMKIAKENSAAKIVVISADRIDRYFSTEVFDGEAT